jgi:hypothetical protein
MERRKQLCTWTISCTYHRRQPCCEQRRHLASTRLPNCSRRRRRCGTMGCLTTHIVRPSCGCLRGALLGPRGHRRPSCLRRRLRAECQAAYWRIRADSKLASWSTAACTLPHHRAGLQRHPPRRSIQPPVCDTRRVALCLLCAAPAMQQPRLRCTAMALVRAGAIFRATTPRAVVRSPRLGPIRLPLRPIQFRRGEAV